MPSERVPARAVAAARLVARLGGRFSTELGIDVDGGAGEVEKWFLASTLFGTRISAQIAMNTYRSLVEGGVATIHDASTRSWGDLVALLDSGGYARYDFRTATRLLELATAVADRYPKGIAALSSLADPSGLEAELDRLPGWGSVTVRVFLRELRGVWPGAGPLLDQRAAIAAAHLGFTKTKRPMTIQELANLAREADIDVRDLESALVRVGLRRAR